LKYDYILKIIKYNKSLQNKIGIEKQNYKDYSNIKIDSIEINEKFEQIEINTVLFSFPPFILKIIRIICCCNIFYKFFINLIAFLMNIFFLFYPIYIYIEQEKLNIILVNFINISLFGLIILRMNFIMCLCTTIHFFALLFFTLIHTLFEIIIIIKSYYLIGKEINFTDKLFLLINFLYISCQFYYIISKWPKKNYVYHLIEYKNIKIEPYLINFESYKKNKQKYISNIFGKLKYYNNLEEDMKIFRKINNFRNKNHLPYLEPENNLPDFIKNEISEVILFKWKNLFILPKNKYLFKYDFGKFNYYFQNNDKELIQILLKSELNRIKIITQKNIQYILLYECDIDFW
jgi:hypothetical protein